MSQKTSHKTLLLSSPSRAFGCVQRYIQGPGEIGHIFEYGARYGKSFLFIVDEGVHDLVKSKVDAIEFSCGCEYDFLPFSGECCRENVAKLTKHVLEKGCDVLVGAGGGKVLDVAKLVADEADIARIILPTSASSDAPAADWAAVYDLNGVHLGGVPTRRSTELVLVDSDIIAKAPARLFAAGIADALATWFEALANERAFTANNIGRGYVSCRAGMAVSRECYEVLIAEGKLAYEAVKEGLLTTAVEDVIEANILLSGLGFMNAGLAGAHGYHSGFSVIESAKDYLHGEKVAFGLLCQLMLENAPQEQLEKMLRFMDSIDLPVTLAQLGIEASAENLDAVVEHVMNKNPLIHKEPLCVTAAAVRSAILAADAFGRNYLTAKN